MPAFIGQRIEAEIQAWSDLPRREMARRRQAQLLLKFDEIDDPLAIALFSGARASGIEFLFTWGRDLESADGRARFVRQGYARARPIAT